MLEARAAEHPDRPAQTFLIDGETEGDRRTFAQLARRVKAVAARLQADVAPGDRALLLYQPGLEGIEALLACLYADVIAVPAYPPDPLRLERTLPRLMAIVDDATPTVVLTTDFIASLAGALIEQAPGLARLRWIATDTTPEEGSTAWVRPGALSPSSTAFLQYSSGSTRTPRGVVLSHENLLANARMIEDAFILEPADVGVTWLPTYHDMGLIGGVLQPLNSGVHTYLMSPLDFLKQPMRWPRAVSRYRATVSGGPDFAYDLCVRKSTPEERAALDLSSWSLAFNGAETVRAETLRRFSEAFAVSRFRGEACYPCYGLAEATLIVSGKHRADSPRVIAVNADALEQHRVELYAGHGRRTELVTCGPAVADTTIAIVDPVTGSPLPEGVVGEIEVRGAAVASRYWDRPEESAATFIPDREGGVRLRTGDMGFLLDGELVPCSRIKDLIIIRGRNVYPQDVEGAVDELDPALRPGCAAAFAVDTDAGEGLVVCIEVETFDPAEGDRLTERIVNAVQAEFGVRPIAVSLLERRTLPKTSSGKTQRVACRTAWLANGLDVVFAWRDAGVVLRTDGAAATASATERSSTRGVEEIRAWLTARLGAELGVAPGAIATDQPLAELGVDSTQLAGALGEFETWLGATLPVTVFWRHPTIDLLAAALAAEDSADAAAVAAAVADEVAAEAVVVDGDDRRDVAIVGIGCRFPGTHGPAEFWASLVAGVDGVASPPEGHPGADTAGRTGGFLADVRGFDPRFFRMTPREAERLDPQQRLLLETAWEAFEDAGIVPGDVAGTDVGVFVGISQNDYQLIGFRQGDVIDGHALTGTAHAMAPNRLSYFFDLHGPSLAVDTACSSSLVALHLACRSIRDGEASTALAGGVNLLLAPEIDAAFRRAGMLAPGGRCRTFDADADGYVRGEGVALVVLKPLDAAVRDGDRIYAVVRGSAVVQDGRSNGITAPNGLAQQRTVRRALSAAGIRPSQLAYVEAHGTGTPLGDPIEVESLRTVLEADRPDAPVLLGSVKANVGHLEAAAGIAGVVKAALAAYHGVVPPHANLVELNPDVDLGAGILEIPTEARPWPSAPERNAVGVSSFGFGGTNAHVVLVRPPAATGDEPNSDLPVLVASGHTPTAAAARAGQLAEACESLTTAEDWTSLRFTANARRPHLAHRIAVVADEPDAAAARLRQAAVVEAGRGPKIGFVFGGQGARLGVGADLFEADPAFRAHIEQCESLLGPLRGIRLRDWLFGPRPDGPVPTEVAQPALVALSTGVAAVLRRAGIEPAAVAGHSVGEIAAAWAAGAVTLEGALRFAAERGRVMEQGMPEGAMAAVFAPAEDVERTIGALGSTAAVAARNAPHCTVVAGEPDDIARLLADGFEAEGVDATLLPTDRAFHSPAVDGCLAEIEAAAAAVVWDGVTMPFASTLTGARHEPGWAPDAAYWRDHARRAVQFDAGVQALRESGCELFVEIGFGSGLTPWGRRLTPDAEWRPALDAGQDARHSLAEVVAAAFVRGADIDWNALLPPRRGAVVSLPPYPFDRQPYWFKTAEPVAAPAPAPMPVRSASVLSPSLASGPVEEWSNALARRLMGFGVGPGRVVALVAEPGLSALAGALAVYKTGAAIFVVERSVADPTGSLAELDITVAVASPAARGRLVGFPGEIVVADPALRETEIHRSSTAPVAHHRPADGAVLVYETVDRLSGPASVDLAAAERIWAELDDEVGVQPGDVMRVSGSDLHELGVLQLLWAHTRGAAVEFRTGGGNAPGRGGARLPALSLSFFGCYPAEADAEKYRLVLDAARLADQLGFEAVWTPERHFDVFGGAFPAPAVLSAALARETTRVAIRAGSVVLPLHHAVRVAEEWALVDNLSGGRAGLALASGWNARDLILSPDPERDPVEAVEQGLELMRRLWRGDEVHVDTGRVAPADIRLHPLPLRPDMPVWLTILRNPESWRRAARLGTNVLTNLMGQSIEDLAQSIAGYRGASAAAGRPSGKVTVLVHTLVGEDDDAAVAAASDPLRAYLRDSIGLFSGALRFPWIKEYMASLNEEDLASEIDAITELARKRYLDSHALIGGAARCVRRLEDLRAAGVDEVACLVDFGVERGQVLAGIEQLAALRDRPTTATAPVPVPYPGAFAEIVRADSTFVLCDTGTSSPAQNRPAPAGAVVVDAAFQWAVIAGHACANGRSS